MSDHDDFAFDVAPGIPAPLPFVTNEQDMPLRPMPDTNGVWATTRFVEPTDLAHDAHVNIVTFQPGQPLKKLTNANAGLMAARAIGKVEEIKWNSFDGKSMQGWLIYPPTFDATKRYPLILDIHGGPHAMYGVEFNHQMQIFAARGEEMRICIEGPERLLTHIDTITQIGRAHV